jgi:hypothetical protein
VTGALAGNGVFGFPMRRLGHGFGHGLVRHLALHSLFHHGLWSIFGLIVVLAVAALLVRWIVVRRRSNY